jgi:hypothetical protein
MIRRRETMTRLVVVVSVWAAFGVLLPAGGAQADKIKDITCEQFLEMDEAQQDDIVYWIHGVHTASSKKAEAAEEVDVGYDVFGRPVAAVVTACEADKKASLWEKIKAHF